MGYSIAQKQIRKYRQRQKICHIYILCRVFEHFNMMMLHATLASMKNEYEQSVSFSNAINDIFGVETSAETFMHDNDEESNNAIKEYKALKELLRDLSEAYQKSILAFCKHLYYQNEFSMLAVDGYLFYPMYLEWVTKYIDGNIRWDEVRNHIVDFKPWYKQPKTIDSCCFRKEFIRIEEIYKTIDKKRNLRKTLMINI